MANIITTRENAKAPTWSELLKKEGLPDIEIWYGGDHDSMREQWIEEDQPFDFYIRDNNQAHKRAQAASYKTLIVHGCKRDAVTANVFNAAYERIMGEKWNFLGIQKNQPTKIIFAFDGVDTLPWAKHKRANKSWNDKEPSICRYRPYTLRKFPTQDLIADAVAAFVQNDPQYQNTKAANALIAAARKRKNLSAQESRAKQRKLEKQEAMKIK